MDEAQPPEQWPECLGCRHHGFLSLLLLCLSIFYTTDNEQNQVPVTRTGTGMVSPIQFNLTGEVLKHCKTTRSGVTANICLVISVEGTESHFSVQCNHHTFPTKVFYPPLPKTQVPHVAHFYFAGHGQAGVVWHKGLYCLLQQTTLLHVIFFQTSITAAHRGTRDIVMCHGAWKLQLSYNKN